MANSGLARALRRGHAHLADLLNAGTVVMHPFILGEIALGSLSDRDSILELLGELPAALSAEPDEVLRFIDTHQLHGKGIGYVDGHLLASVSLVPGTKLWTRDKRLRLAAEHLGCDYARIAAH